MSTNNRSRVKLLLVLISFFRVGHVLFSTFFQASPCLMFVDMREFLKYVFETITPLSGYIISRIFLLKCSF